MAARDFGWDEHDGTTLTISRDLWKSITKTRSCKRCGDTLLDTIQTIHGSSPLCIDETSESRANYSRIPATHRRAT
jgi:hypothetical protein